MDTPGTSTYLALIFLVVCSAFFSASETALSTFNKVRMQNLAEKGDRKAKTALQMSEHYSKTLSTILIGNNIVNMGGASLATVVATALFGAASGPAIATFGMTLLVLIFGEIMPKTLARSQPEKISMLFAPILRTIQVVLTPVVWCFVQLNKLLIPGKQEEVPSVTEDELKSILSTAEAEGVLNEQETGILHSVIEFDDTTAQEILTPRVDMEAIDVEDSIAEVLEQVLESGYSRLPVYEEDLDHILGILHTRDLLACLAKGQTADLRQLCREAMFIYRTKNIDELLTDFRREKCHMAIVTDDFGGTLGLVTMEDILEELVGEIFDESDDAEDEELELEKIDPYTFRLAGECDIRDAFEVMDLDEETLEEDCFTAAGWALEALGHIPTVGEVFHAQGAVVTVEEMDDKRILSLLVHIPQFVPGEAKEEK